MDRRKKLTLFAVFIAILILGGFLRFWKLNSSPPSLNWDEASMGYNAYSLIMTGKDEYAQTLPLSFRSFDDYKPPLYFYFTVPFIYTFGLYEWPTRISATLCSFLVIILLYIFVRRELKNIKIALLSSFIIAISPWSVNFSRMAFEANIALAMWLISLILFKKKRISQALFWSLLSTFAYNSAKVYFGLFILLLLIAHGKKYLKQIAISLIPFVLAIMFTSSLARFSTTSVFSLWKDNPNIYYFSSEIINRYFSYFNPANIYVRTSNEPTHKVTGLGLFYSFEFLGFFIGLWYLYKIRLRLSNIVWWLMLGSLPSVLTWSWFSTVRILPFWTMLCVVEAIGLYIILKKFKLLAPVFTYLWFVNISWLVIALILRMPYLEHGNWQWGFRETIRAIGVENIKKYNQVVWDSPHAQPHIFVLFYTKYSPLKYQFETKDLPKSSRKSFDFGKIVFRDIYWPKDRDMKDTLFVGDVFGLPIEDILRDKRRFLNIRSPEDYISTRVVFSN